MKKFLATLLTVILFETSADAADKIRISMTGFAGQFMTFPLAQKRGFLKEEGIEAEIIRIAAAAGRAALASGEVDYSTGIGGTAIGGALSGIPIKVVACYVPAPVLALVSRPEYKTVVSLKGKTVAILISGGVAHFAARQIAKHFGLDADKELKYLAVGAPDARFAALSQGLVEAAVLGPPLDFEARRQGMNILARANDIFVFPETGLVTSVKKLQDKPDEIKRVIRAGIKANRYIRNNRDGTVQFLIEWLKLTRENAAATYDSVVKVYDDDINLCDKGLRLVVDETKKSMKLTRDVPYSDIADLSILREAQRELSGK
ncbi:MAG TPA: ABC transporter substrate-binding protein [Verrucomicrobiae bacterium]|nr:ABC transporter substrate-binding protein [Verrucomicrobiae bacterium]